MRRITAKQIAIALGCTDRSIREREGRTMPQPIDAAAAVHEYDLRSVLIAVNGMERKRICERMGVQITIAISQREIDEFNPKAEPIANETYWQRLDKTTDPELNSDRFF